MMRMRHENMTVAEFICRHEKFPEPTDINGVPLPLEATIRVEYLDGQPEAYAVTDETGIVSWNAGHFRRFKG